MHLSVVNRIVNMGERAGNRAAGQVVFTGGVARNPCILDLLRQRPAPVEVVAPEEPDLTGALGAALAAAG